MNNIKASDVEIGDFVPQAGIFTKPGVVKEVLENGQVVIDTSPEALQIQRHGLGLTTGLTLDEKFEFNKIMDEIKSMQSAPEQINALQEKLDELKGSGASKKLTGRLLNEQARLIRMSGELPRVYTMERSKIDIG